jgi:hypothetical protein
MKLLKMFKSLVAKTSPSETAEMRCIVIMQRKAQQFSEEELRIAAELGWGKKFDGKEDPMYFVSADHSVLDVVKAGPHIIRVTSVPTAGGPHIAVSATVPHPSCSLIARWVGGIKPVRASRERLPHRRWLHKNAHNKPAKTSQTCRQNGRI